MKRKPIAWMWIVVVGMLLLLDATGYAQKKDEEVSAGRKVTFFSKTLDEERTLFISLPGNYEQSKKRYPVLYVADGGEYRLIASGGMLKYFAGWRIPELIAVFIPNTDRGRDYSVSPRPIEQVPNSGGQGGENFLRFLGDELFSFIDKNYRTTSYRIFMGYSATAGFVFHTLLARPDYFDATIAASPSFFFTDDLFERTEQFFRAHPSLDKFLYVPYYDRDFKTATDFWPRLDRIIRANMPAGFRYQTRVVNGQAHVPPSSLFDGLMALFADWRRVKEPEITPGNGRLTRNGALTVEIRGFDTEVRYTLDGSEPTRESALYSAPLQISWPLVLKAKSFRGQLSESDEVSAAFSADDGAINAVSPHRPVPGLRCRYFEHRWFNLPDAIDAAVASEGLTRTIDLSCSRQKDGFMLQFDGFIRIARAGLYRFHLLSTSGCKLFLDEVKLIDNPAIKAAIDPLYEREEYSYALALKPGYYPLRVLYANAWDQGSEFRVSFEGPGVPKQEIPAGVLFHEAKQGEGK